MPDDVLSEMSQEYMYLETVMGGQLQALEMQGHFERLTNEGNAVLFLLTNIFSDTLREVLRKLDVLRYFEGDVSDLLFFLDNFDSTGLATLGSGGNGGGGGGGGIIHLDVKIHRVMGPF